jgi:hypothetical protein
MAGRKFSLLDYFIEYSKGTVLACLSGRRFPGMEVQTAVQGNGTARKFPKSVEPREETIWTVEEDRLIKE